MELIRPENKKVLTYLTRDGRSAPPFNSPEESSSDPYFGCGCHPDIVERIWKQLGLALPSDCRGLVYGTPALVHTGSAVILAIGLGTQYAFRVAGKSIGTVKQNGAKTEIKWSNGTTLDTQEILGSEWFVGSFNPKEIDWCREAYDIWAL